MHRKYLNFFRMFIIIILYSSIPIRSGSAQTKTNLQIFYLLVDSSIAKASKSISSQIIKPELNLPGVYSIFKNQAAVSFTERNIKFFEEKYSSGDFSEFSYVIEEANVNYGEIFRKSFLGDFYLPRKVSLKGNYLVRNYNETNAAWLNEPFEVFYVDTIEVDEVKDLENPAYQFTHGEIPSEPFFSSLLEPVIAIGTAAIAVYLFFTVRSR